MARNGWGGAGINHEGCCGRDKLKFSPFPKLGQTLQRFSKGFVLQRLNRFSTFCWHLLIQFSDIRFTMPASFAFNGFKTLELAAKGQRQRLQCQHGMAVPNRVYHGQLTYHSIEV
jgi:hypothetical protein